MVWKKVILTSFYGTLLALVGVVIAYIMLPSGVFDVPVAEGVETCTSIASGELSCHAEPGSTYLDTGYARRWDGACTGWDKGLAMKFIIGDLMHWWAYVLISFMIITRHPIKKDIKGHAFTMWLTAAFIAGCGLTHLVSAYTVLNPVYKVQGWVNIVNGSVSVVAMFTVVYGLVKARSITDKQNTELTDGLKKLLGKYDESSKKDNT